MTRAKRPRGAPIDWFSVRARLDRAAHAAELLANPAPSQTQALLEERARALARPVAPRSAAARVEVIVFRVATERYAIPLAEALEVARLGEVAPIPGAPRPFAGVTSLRGELVPLLDLADFLGSGRAERGAAGASQPTFLVIGAEGAELGIIADEVIGVEALDAPEIVALKASAPLSEQGARPIVRGPTARGLFVIDVGALLADERLFVDQRDRGVAGRGPGEERG